MTALAESDPPSPSIARSLRRSRSPRPGFAERLAVAGAIGLALAVAAPLISLAFNAARPAGDVWPHLIAYVLPQALRTTVVLVGGVAALSLAIGVGSAWLISTYDFPGRRAMLWLTPLPLALPTYLAAYIYVDMVEPLGLVHRALAAFMPLGDAARWLPGLRSLPGAIAVFAIVLYPYVYFSALAMFQARSLDSIEAARILGASRWMRMWRVSLPMARPALAVGAALVALETLNDIGATDYMGVRTLTVAIFDTWLNRGSLAGAAQIALLLMAFVAVVILFERYGRRLAGVESSAEHPNVAPRRSARGWRGAAVLGACTLPPLFGFIVPVIYLGAETMRRTALSGVDPALWRDLWNSVALSGCATAVALTLSLLAVLAVRWRPGGIRIAALTAAQSGYMLPGLVLALGLLAPLTLIDQSIHATAKWMGLPSPGLLLLGSGAAVVAAYAIRFAAVPTGLIGAGLARIPRDYDDSAATVAASRPTTFGRILLPLLRPALVGSAIVVFVDCLKELPATLLLRPLNVETLATSIFQHASRGNFEDGSLAALLIIAASVGPVMWLTRYADRLETPV